MPLDACFSCGSPARYRCPGCDAQSCSLECVEQHKRIKQGDDKASTCSGIRNKAKYIPPKEYGYGALMDDYAYLEQVNRVIGEASKKRKLDLNEFTAAASVGSPRNARTSRHGRELPFWVVKAREERVNVVLLDPGMERSRLNQTRWNSKASYIHYTISFIFKKADSKVDVVLTIHNNPATYSLNDILAKPLSDGRARACGLSQKRLDVLKSALTQQSLTFLLPVLKDPRRSRYQPEPEMPPTPPDSPPIQPISGAKLHPSLPNRPDLVPSAVEQKGLESAANSPVRSSVSDLPSRPQPPIPAVNRTVTRVKGLTRPLLPVVAPHPTLRPGNAVPEEVPSKLYTEPSRQATPIKRKSRKSDHSILEYRILYGTLSLQSQLRGHTIIEWPSIEVWIDDELDAFRESSDGAAAFEILDFDSSDSDSGSVSHAEISKIIESDPEAILFQSKQATKSSVVPSSSLIGLASYASDSDEDDSEEREIARSLLKDGL